MKKLPLLLALPLLLSACGGSSVRSPTLRAHLENPLFAERYWAEMVDRMTNMQIQNDPLLKDPNRAALVDEAKRDALQQSEDIRSRMREGLSADFLTIAEQTEGHVLLLDGTLYLSTTFASYPGPSLHVYLTMAVDPRDTEFPDPTSLDLGTLQSPYGAQQYVLPEDEKANIAYRTVVLWDTELQRLYAFAQLG